MNLREIVGRQIPPEPWSDGEKIPWHDPDFSARMLKEHLSQTHDLASRRFSLIDEHVGWIHGKVLGERPARILDLGCGPGLYIHRLARFGHACVGIDFAPAAIAYGRATAHRDGLDCRFVEADVRSADYGSGFGLAMMLYGEINVFRPSDARLILTKARAALKKGGLLLLEASTIEAVRKLGEASATWYSADHGIFSGRPHLCLSESSWDAARKVSTERYFIVDAETGFVSRYAASTQGYTPEEYDSLLRACGYDRIETYPPLAGSDSQPGYFAVLAARKV